MTEKTVERDSDLHLQHEMSAEVEQFTPQREAPLKSASHSICNVKSVAPADEMIDDIEILDVEVSDRNASLLDSMMQKHAEAPLMAQQSTLD
jgi:hypothetical protein